MTTLTATQRQIVAEEFVHYLDQEDRVSLQTEEMLEIVGIKCLFSSSNDNMLQRVSEELEFQGYIENWEIPLIVGHVKGMSHYRINRSS